MTRPVKTLQNDIRDQFCDFWYGSIEREENGVWPLWIDDIFAGVSRLDYYSLDPKRPNTPLSTVNLITIFTTLDTISTPNIMELLTGPNGQPLSRRQASRYSQACRIAYPFLKKVLDNNVTVKYPSVSFLLRDS